MNRPKFNNSIKLEAYHNKSGEFVLCHLMYFFDTESDALIWSYISERVVPKIPKDADWFCKITKNANFNGEVMDWKPV
jgi:hypothetical protein